MNITEDLILTPPLWAVGKNPRVLAYGPFVAQQGKKRLVGMYLMRDDEKIISFWDGNRNRYFEEDEINLRGMEVKDADLVQLDKERAGLTKEDVITKALLLFQNPPM